MATLAADKSRNYEAYAGEVLNDLPVIAADIIYEGAAVGENAAGYMRPLVAADPFVGFAVKQVDNAAGAAGDKDVKVRSCGFVQLAISALAITANDGVAVYASDDDTFTLTAAANSLIGHVHRWISTGVAIVHFEAVSMKGASA